MNCPKCNNKLGEKDIYNFCNLGDGDYTYEIYCSKCGFADED